VCYLVISNQYVPYSRFKFPANNSQEGKSIDLLNELNNTLRPEGIEILGKVTEVRICLPHSFSFLSFVSTRAELFGILFLLPVTICCRSLLPYYHQQHFTLWLNYTGDSRRQEAILCSEGSSDNYY
jgi:hypothetical protein